MEIQEIRARDLNAEKFIKEEVEKIKKTVGNGIAITALSGGVDSSTVTMLGHKALAKRLKPYFIENGLMRENEAQTIVSLFKGLGVQVNVVDAKEEFFNALRGIIDPEEKREAIAQTFYKKVFGRLVRESNAKFLLQGTILTDIEETVAGIKRQHNVFEQLGINPQEAFGYQIIEPLARLRKDGVRKVARVLSLPKSVYNRMPFPGPALATRVIGEVTLEKIALVRKATAIMEEAIEEAPSVIKRLKEICINGSYSTKKAVEFIEKLWGQTRPFQCMAILHEDRVTGIRNNKREYGLQIEIRCWNSIDARVATPTRLPHEVEEGIADRITSEILEVVNVTFNRSKKPPSTMEAI